MAEPRGTPNLPAPPFRAPADRKAIIAELLATDTPLRDLSRQFVVLGMREVLDQLVRGDQATRATIARSLASVITSAITESGEEDGDATLRAEMHEMMAEIRGELMGQQEELADPPARVIVPKK